MGLFGGKKRKQRLEEAGVNAQAVLVTVRDTGVTVNNNPRLSLAFQVAAADGSGPFQVETKKTVSRVTIPRAGGAGAVQRGSAAELLASGQRMTAVLREFSASGRTVGDSNPAAPDPNDPVYVIKAELLVDGSSPIEAVFMHRVPEAKLRPPACASERTWTSR